jgi:hypothetical protein
LLIGLALLAACEPIELDVRETDAEVVSPPPANACEMAGRLCVPDDQGLRLCPDGSRAFEDSCGDLSPALCCAVNILSDCELRLGECVTSAFGGQCPSDYEKTNDSCDVSGRPPGDICCTRIQPSPCELEGHFCFSGMCPPGSVAEAASCLFNPESRICCSM